jgi:hypothetical protein
MNLLGLYDSLYIPESDERIFNAIPIPEYPSFRIATDTDSNPIVLLAVANPTRDLSLKNFRLKYLQLEQNLECKISENGSSLFQNFTVITFTGNDRNLQEYFFRIVETLIKTLGNRPTQSQIVISLNKFVEIFRALSDTPTKTIHGVWSELFLIANSSNPTVLLNYWHNVPEEKFDFNSGREKIEVKSNANFERLHIFSAEQLNPLNNTQVVIASIFIRQNTNGMNVQELVEAITYRLSNNLDLIEKLNTIVCTTLGSSLEQSIRIKFDYEIAQQSMRLYDHRDVKKIQEIHIPNEVSEVRYKSDLSGLDELNMKTFIKEELLQAL